MDICFAVTQQRLTPEIPNASKNPRIALICCVAVSTRMLLFVIYWRLLPKHWQLLTPCSGRKANIFTLEISSGKKASQPRASATTAAPSVTVTVTHLGPCTTTPTLLWREGAHSRSRLSGIHPALWARTHTPVPRVSPLSRACFRVPSDFISNRQGER